MNQAVDRSYLYVALGSDFLEEVIDSIAAMRLVDRFTPITLYTDSAALLPEDVRSSIQHVRDLPSCTKFSQDKKGLFAKVDAILDCPADKVIFIDTDTIPVSRFELWDVLERFPLMFGYDPIRYDHLNLEIPDAFPTPNTGLVGVDRRGPALEVIRRWRELFETQMNSDNPPLHDQPAFRQAVYESDVRFLVLPDEFNLRVTFNHLLAGNARVKMLHGRHAKLESAKANAHTVHFLPRVYGRTYGIKELAGMLCAQICGKLGLRREVARRGAVHKD